MSIDGFACRACGERAVAPVLSLGAIPLVNALVEPGGSEPDPRYPLEVVRCLACTLVQITETVAPEVLFRTYSYFSSYSDSFLAHAREFASRSIRELALAGASLVVEAASNDGYLLQYFAEAGVPVLGIEPARNVAASARERGIETIAEFLDPDVAKAIVADRGEADLVVANNVLAHVPDLPDFVSALRTLAGDRGVVALEFPYLCDLVDRLEFDTIYHEHLSYFTLTSLAPVLARHGLGIRAVERLSVHGGSLRVLASADADSDSRIEQLLAEELEWGVSEGGRFDDFARAVATLREELHELVAALVASGSVVAAYGAAAKGVVLANVCELDARLVTFVVDRNPAKQGKLLPGVRIPVEPPEALARHRPEYCLLFAWNLTDEITRQQVSYTDAGGRFIVPLPAPRVLT